jgi:hypothetical protein
MTIYLGSRYETSVVDFITYRTNIGPVPVVFYEFNDIGKLKYFEYRWQDGDRIDELASRFLTYPENWWAIAEVNPEIKDFTSVPVGAKLRIPRV